MQRLEVSGAVRLISNSLGVKGLVAAHHILHVGRIRVKSYFEGKVLECSVTGVSYWCDVIPQVSKVISKIVTNSKFYLFTN